MNISELFNPENFKDTIWPLIVTYTPKLIGLIVALIITKIVARACEKLVIKSLRQKDEALKKFLSSLAKYAVLTIGVVTALSYVGIQTASFAAVIAASGLAIGLAFQGTLSNFSAGVMLLLFRPFKVDDFVQAGGETGFIVAIELFSTEIRTPDSKRIIVPNSSIFGKNITNYSYHPSRRVDIKVGTAYSDNVDKTRKILETIPSKVDGALTEPAPQIFLAGLGSSSIDWEVRIWCKNEDYWDVYQRTTEISKQTLDEANIQIPFPQQDIHFDEGVIRAMKSA